MSHKPRIAIDMDGVLANLDLFMQNFHGKHWKELEPNFLWRPFSLTEQNLFFKLEPINGALEFLEKIIERYNSTHEIFILTALPYPTGYLITAAEDKERWIRRYLHDTIPVHTVLGGVNKRYFVNSQDDILIDDTEKVIDKWIEYGGRGIKHRNFNESLHHLGNIIK